MSALLLAAALIATPALAQDGHMKAAHGGRVVEAGAYHVEMLSKDGQIDVYLADHDNKPKSAKGYKGVAILAIDGKSTRVVLESSDGAKLSGKAAGALPAAPKGVVQITEPGGKTVQARFN
jgi:hypothetical protein